MKPANGTLSTIALLLTALGASAQTSYPEKPVRVVAPFPAGSGADIVAISGGALPYLYFTPYGFLGIVVIIFIVLARDQVRLAEESMRRAAE